MRKLSNTEAELKKSVTYKKACLYFVFLSLEMQKKTWTGQSIPRVFLFCLKKKTTHKPLKVVAAKTLFSSAYVIGATCFDECFFVLCDNWKTLLNITLRFFKAPCCCFLWSQCFERSPYFMRHLRNNNKESHWL